METLCYICIPGNEPGKRIGIVKYGESGYYLTDFDNASMSAADCKTFVEEQNGRLDVPADVCESMFFASMFGWHVPAADRAHHYVKHVRGDNDTSNL